MPASFIHGVQLAREFHAEVVGPLLAAEFPDLRYAAALLGPGSEVQGFDTERSTDHDWGPRLQVFLTDADTRDHVAAIRDLLASRLPESFRGYPVAFPLTKYPDGGGAAVVTARLARDLMRLCLLMHRRYPPYSKWLGSAFARLPGNGPLSAALTTAISRTTPGASQPFLALALETAAAWHNELSLTPPLDTRTRGFYDRPYQVIEAGRFVTALRAEITDPRLRRLPLTGGVDQFIDNTDALGDLRLLRRTIAGILAAYEA